MPKPDLREATSPCDPLLALLLVVNRFLPLN